MKRKLGIVVLTLIIAATTLMAGKLITKEQDIYINEVRSWDASGTRDGYFGSDYIELYNDSDEDISLNGWFISDDAKNLKKCQIYNVVIESKGFVLLYANEKNDTGDSLNFKLNPDGEKIYLSDAHGYLVDSVMIPEQEYGTVYARVTDGAKEWCVKEESTDCSNNEAKNLPIRSLEIPVFSHESGFYEAPFELTMEANVDGTIYYTLDGSQPTEESSKYKEPILIENISNQPNILSSVRNVVKNWEEYFPSTIPVDKAIIVRAIVIDEQENTSEIVTKSYFVDESDYQDKYVVSVIADFDEMFGEQGIFVTGKKYDEGESGTPNFLRSGRQWEIQGNMEILQNGKSILNQKIGIRTQGASTRNTAKKKMSLYSRDEYSGSSYFEGLTLGGKKIHSVYTNHAISNVVFPDLLNDRAVTIQHPKECTVFLNGEYWYDTYLMEKYNKYFLEETYEVNPENVIIIKNDSATEGPIDAYDYYLGILGSAAIHDMSIPEEYERFKEKADIQSYIDYMCANVYLCNMDMSETKNILCWRTVENEGTNYGDTKWRWMIYDIDCVEWVNHEYYDAEEKAAINSFTKEMKYTQMAINEHKIYASCKNNPEFSKQFVLSFLDMANVNFSMDNVEKAFEKWSIELDEDLKEFFENRFDYIVPYMAEEFSLSGSLETVTLEVNDTEGGIIRLNTTFPNVSDGEWTGRYYTDYPLTVTAVPADGYKFIGWSGSVNSDSGTMEVEVLPGGITLEAVFEKTAN